MSITPLSNIGGVPLQGGPFSFIESAGANRMFAETENYYFSYIPGLIRVINKATLQANDTAITAQDKYSVTIIGIKNDRLVVRKHGHSTIEVYSSSNNFTTPTVYPMPTPLYGWNAALYYSKSQDLLMVSDGYIHRNASVVNTSDFKQNFTINSTPKFSPGIHYGLSQKAGNRGIEWKGSVYFSSGFGTGGSEGRGYTYKTSAQLPSSSGVCLVPSSFPEYVGNKSLNYPLIATKKYLFFFSYSGSAWLSQPLLYDGSTFKTNVPYPVYLDMFCRGMYDEEKDTTLIAKQDGEVITIDENFNTLKIIGNIGFAPADMYKTDNGQYAVIGKDKIVFITL